MRVRWEYLIVIYEMVAKKVNEGWQIAETDDWEYEVTHYIFRRGNTEPEVRPGGNWLDLVNDLGDEGWELVGSSVLGSTIVQTLQGFNEVSYPLRVRHTFKRPGTVGNSQ